MIKGDLESFHRSIVRFYRNDQDLGSSSEYDDSSISGDIKTRFEQEVDGEQDDNEELGGFTESETDHDTNFGEGGGDSEVSSDEELEITQENADDMVDIAREMRNVDINSDAGTTIGPESKVGSVMRSSTEVTGTGGASWFVSRETS